MQSQGSSALIAALLGSCLLVGAALGNDGSAAIPVSTAHPSQVVDQLTTSTPESPSVLASTATLPSGEATADNSTAEPFEEIEGRVLVPVGTGHSQGCRSYQGGVGRCVPYSECGVSFENEFLARSSLCGFSNRRPLVCCPHDTYGYGLPSFQSSIFPGFQQNFFQQNPFANSFFYTPAQTFYQRPQQQQQPSYGYQQPSYGGYNPGFGSGGFNTGGFNSNPPYGYQPLQQPFVRPQQPSYQQPTFVGSLPTVSQPRPPVNQLGLPSVRPPFNPPTRNERPPIQQDSQLNSPYCGLTNATTKRIVGGQEAAVGAWPWLSLLFVDVSGNGYKAPLCGGALINPTHILTAAHCVNLMGNVLPANRFTARLGEHDYLATNDGANPVDIDISRVFSHPQFNNRTYLNDIAIMRLRRPVSYGQGIAPICVPTTPGDDSEYKGSASVAGWGELYYAGPASSILQEVTIPIQTLDTCKEAFKRTVIEFNENYLCAGSLEGDRDTCRGDSGGPLMWDNGQGRYTVIGVTSFGRRCAEKGYPGSYTRVAKYTDWMRSVLAQP